MDEMEASADARQVARVMYDQYLAFLKEGFSESQAIRLIGHMLQAGGK